MRKSDVNTFLSCIKCRKKIQNERNIWENELFDVTTLNRQNDFDDLKETMMVNMTVVDDENKEISLTATKEVIEAVIDIKTDEDLFIDQLLELNMCIVYNRNTNIIHQIEVIEFLQNVILLKILTSKSHLQNIKLFSHC